MEILKNTNMYKITWEKLKGHLKTVFTHKRWVFYYMCKIGMPWAGLKHDLSKFSFTEFWESVRYYDGKVSPIVICKKENGYSKAWQHHKGRNPHHYEYWMDNFDKGGTPIKMPFRYAAELICDYLAAGKAYNGKDFTYEQELAWWNKKRSDVLWSMHSSTVDFITNVFTALYKGEKLSKRLLKKMYDLS